MKMNSAMTHRMLAFAIVILASFAAPISYAQKAALVKNVDERGRSPYIVRVSCAQPLTISCFASAAAVPAGKRLVIEHISAQIQLRDPAKLALLDIFVTSVGFVAFFPATFVNDDGQFSNWVVNETTLVYAEAGAIPTVDLSATGVNVNLTAVLSGYLVDLSL
jgi:hypothetical protein